MTTTTQWEKNRLAGVRSAAHRLPAAALWVGLPRRKCLCRMDLKFRPDGFEPVE